MVDFIVLVFGEVVVPISELATMAFKTITARLMSVVQIVYVTAMVTDKTHIQIYSHVRIPVSC
ncbi:hypothetical protein D3C87_2171290 [compost metagenome]